MNTHQVEWPIKLSESSANEPSGFPDCWKVPKNRVLALLFHGLCLITMTRPTLNVGAVWFMADA
ncbi:hypothetical protein BDR03DRAFT_946927 [Suillus americanus]|nr:hypothetical protein BDR03DRAFT_946927 [Suillus americanus]